MSPSGIGTVLQKCNVQPIQLMNIFLSLPLFMLAGLQHGFPVINKVVPPDSWLPSPHVWQVNHPFLLLELFVPSPSAVPWAQEPLVFREPPVQLFPAPEAVLNNKRQKSKAWGRWRKDREASWAFLGPRGRFLPKNGEQTISDLI